MRILLPVDDSEQSYNAARALAHLPASEQIIVLHALDVPEPAYPMIVPEAVRELSTMVEQSMREDGKRLVNRVASILPNTVGPISTHLEVGIPAEVIVSTAEKERADLIVMGARGLGPIKEIAFGSVSHRVVTYAPCPVLTIRTPILSLRRVLLAIEGLDDAEAAIRFFKKKPFKNPVEITVLTVLPFTHPIWTERVSDTQSMKEMALRSASRFVEDVAAQLSTVQYRATPVTTIGSPVHAILQHATDMKMDLILLGSRGRKGASRFLLGSVSHKVLHLAPYPVLIIR